MGGLGMVICGYHGELCIECVGGEEGLMVRRRSECQLANIAFLKKELSH